MTNQKLYRVELEGFGTIEADVRTLDKIKDVFLDAAHRSAEMIEYSQNKGHRDTAELFEDDYNKRWAIVEMLGRELEELEEFY